VRTRSAWAWGILAVACLLATLHPAGGVGQASAKVIVQPTPAEATPAPQVNEAAAKSFVLESGRDELLEQLRAESRQPRGGEATLRLGLLYLHGLRVPQDARNAQALFERSLAQGERRAAAALAWCVMDGCVRSADSMGALGVIGRYRNAAPGRMDYLEWLALGRQMPSEARERQRAQLLDRALRARDLHAQNERGIQLFEEERFAEAAELFRLATQQGSQAANRNLELVRARLSDLEAREALAKAGTPADAERLFGRAQAAHRGLGRPANYAEALALYRQDAESDCVAFACRRHSRSDLDAATGPGRHPARSRHAAAQCRTSAACARAQSGLRLPAGGTAHAGCDSLGPQEPAGLGAAGSPAPPKRSVPLDSKRRLPRPVPARRPLSS
jgi:TPR repeat protein